MDRSEASRKGAAVKSMVKSDGWKVLLEQIELRQRHEQKALMHSRARSEDEQGTYERVIGQWAGMERITRLAAGIIALGEQASREMESGQAAEAAGN